MNKRYIERGVIFEGAEAAGVQAQRRVFDALADELDPPQGSSFNSAHAFL